MNKKIVYCVLIMIILTIIIILSNFLLFERLKKYIDDHLKVNCYTETETITETVNNNDVLEEWVSATSKNEYTITVIGLSYCSHCKNYLPVITKFANDNNIKLFWFDIDELSDSDADILSSRYDFSEYDGASPYTAVMKNSEVLLQHVGEMSTSEVDAFFKKLGL